MFISKPFEEKPYFKENGLEVAQASLSIKKKFKNYVRAALTKEIIHASR